jgi:hypothetical protein
MALVVSAFAVAGCSIGDVSPALPPLPPNPPDMEVVTREAARIFVVLKLPGNPELSRLRPAHPSTLADWMFCMRSDAHDIPREYAMFMSKGAVVNYRIAVVVDGCAQEKFAGVGPRP